MSDASITLSSRSWHRTTHVQAEGERARARLVSRKVGAASEGPSFWRRIADRVVAALPRSAFEPVAVPTAPVTIDRKNQTWLRPAVELRDAGSPAAGRQVRFRTREFATRIDASPARRAKWLRSDRAMADGADGVLDRMFLILSPVPAATSWKRPPADEDGAPHRRPVGHLVDRDPDPSAGPRATRIAYTPSGHPYVTTNRF